MPLSRTRILPAQGMTLQQRVKQRIKQETSELRSRLDTAHRSLHRQSKYIAGLLDRIGRLENGIVARDLLVQHLKRQEGRKLAAKLNWEKVREIRRLAENGCHVKTLAQEYGVTPANIRAILKGKTWVEPEPAP